MSKPYMAKRVFSGLLTVLVLLSLAGCPATLKTNQVKEVNKFAQVAEAYGPLPGDVLRAYADQKWELDLINISTETPDEAVQAFKARSAEKKARYVNAARADKALAVLNTYASLLKTLTASDYGEAVDKEAVRFGEAIDAGVGEYNKLASKKLSPFGEYVAVGVSAVGRLYIRNKQGQALKAAVTKAQSSVDELLDETRILLSSYQGDTNDFTRLGKSLGSSFKPVAASWYKTGEPIPFHVLEWYDGQYLAIAQGEKLAQKAYAAAGRYKEAHAKLVEAIESKEKLPEIIGRVEAFASEVEAAVALKKEMKK